jgi:DNA-binding response OmpR family regulator
MSRHRVLVIEDNVDTRETLGKLLRLRGFEVRTADDGPSGVEEAMRWRPDVAFIDIGLPGFDGLEVARRLRTVFGEMTYLVALTAWGGPEDRQRGLEAGFDAYLVKPAPLTELFALAGGAPTNRVEPT